MKTLRKHIGTGLAGNPMYYELVALIVNMENQSIKVKFKTYTEIEGDKVKEVGGTYTIEDGKVHLTINNNVIADTDVNGVMLYEDAQGAAIVDGEGNPVLDGNGNPTFEEIQLPKPRLADFTKMVTAFEPSIWNGVLIPGIEKFLELIPFA